jgi:hypothetical protein
MLATEPRGKGFGSIMTDPDYLRHLDRRARRYQRRQRQLELAGAALHAAASAAREAKRRWWPSLLIAVILDRDYDPRPKRADGSAP